MVGLRVMLFSDYIYLFRKSTVSSRAEHFPTSHYQPSRLLTTSGMRYANICSFYRSFLEVTREGTLMDEVVRNNLLSICQQYMIFSYKISYKMNLNQLKSTDQQ